MQVEASYERWESADFPGEEQRPEMSGRALGQGRGEGDLGCGESWRRLPAALHVWAWILSELCPRSLSPCLPSASHHLFSAPQMWSSEVNSCEENGGGERISRVLLTDGLRGNILALRKRDEKSVLAYNCIGQKFHEFFIVRWYRNTRMNFLAEWTFWPTQ